MWALTILLHEEFQYLSAWATWGWMFSLQALTITAPQRLSKAEELMQLLTDVAWSVLSIQAFSRDCPWQLPTPFHSKKPWLSQSVQMMSLQHWFTSFLLPFPCLETFTNHNMCKLPILRTGNSERPRESFAASCGSLERDLRIPVYHIRCFWPG